MKHFTSLAEKAQEFAGLAEQFSLRVLDTSDFAKANHYYALESDYFPEGSQPPTSTFPTIAQRLAEDVLAAAEQGKIDAELPQMAAHFDRVRASLVSVQSRIDTMYEYDRPRFVSEYIRGALPVIDRVIQRAGQTKEFV